MKHDIKPFEGHYDGAHHMFAVRVYYEDTDFSGIVYHGSYVRFLERARSDMLARIDIDQRSAFESGDGAYAITKLNVNYKQAAKFDDALTIISHAHKVTGARVYISQNIYRGEEHIIAAEIEAAFIHPSGRPVRQPKAWVDAFKSKLTDQDYIHN
jgi:acyl-CoA thioester hydrolase